MNVNGPAARLGPWDPRLLWLRRNEDIGLNPGHARGACEDLREVRRLKVREFLCREACDLVPEPVPVAEARELIDQDRLMRPSQTRPRHVILGQHADPGIDVADIA